METSVVVSTCEAPAQLELCITALARQSALPSEVVVAEDADCARTAELICGMRADLPFPVVHIQQPDNGFRAARNRNNAIHHATHDALLFLDQDILPHRNWLETHCAALRPGRVCLGRVMWLDKELTAQLTVQNVRAGEFERWHSMAAVAAMDSLQRKFSFYTVMRRIGLGIKTRPALGSGNMSACRPDLQKVNGFDEEYVGWGQEDDDLGRRLYMAGIDPMPLVNKALATHMQHAERHAGWKSGSNMERYRRKLSSCRCTKGLADHPHADVTVMRG
jgi:GT2 family glycosyltransferase